MVVLIPRSWECSFPGHLEPSTARSAAPLGLSRCRTPHGAASQQVTALHHRHRAAAATEAQPWLITNRSRTWGKAPEKLKAFGTSGLASASLLPEVTLLLVALQPRARSDPRACPVVPVPNSALGEPIGITAVAGSGVCPPDQCPGQHWVTLLGAAPELQCSLELRLYLKTTPKS